MKGDLFLLYNLEKKGWYGPKGSLVHDAQEAFLYKYAVACELVEMANLDLDPIDTPVVLMVRA